MKGKNPIQEDAKRAFPILSSGVEKGYAYANEKNPELAELLKQLLAILLRPLMALRAKLYRFFFRGSGKQERSKVPIFRIAVIMIGFMLIYHKNLSFAFSIQNPSLVAADLHSPGADQDLGDVAVPREMSNQNEYAPVSAKKLTKQTTQDYIESYHDLAIAEMKKYNIPASITLGQALIESRSGTSRLAVQNNNHFGIKCFSKKCTKGHCTNHFDDHHKDFFRKYGSVWESYRDHSKFLRRKRYEGLQKHGIDYKKWAVGLKKAGYATDKRYDKKLIGVIEKYNLQKYDKE